MINISLNLITKNEAENLSKNFTWLKKCPAINEVVCIDDNSTDDTLKTLKLLSKDNPNITFSIHQNPLNKNFSRQRQLALHKSTNDWILWLDADEVPSQQLINFLNNLKPTHQSYSFKRKDIFLGQKLKHGETNNQNFTRLFNKNYGKYIHPVHEVWESTKKTKETDLEIIHHSHPNMTSFLRKINFYTDIRAKELYDQNKKSNLFQIIFYPLAKFFQNYLLRLGFLDGVPGIILALSMSLHSFVVRAKLWKLWQK